jgi:hypothetical protein
MYQRSVGFAFYVALALMVWGPSSAKADTLDSTTLASSFALGGESSRHAIAPQFNPKRTYLPVALAAAAPEPSGIALLGIGMLGAAAIVRRRLP